MKIASSSRFAVSIIGDQAPVRLAIVLGIAKAHGGRADVTSRPGEGTIFWISLPR